MAREIVGSQDKEKEQEAVGLIQELGQSDALEKVEEQVEDPKGFGLDPKSPRPKHFDANAFLEPKGYKILEQRDDGRVVAQHSGTGKKILWNPVPAMKKEGLDPTTARVTKNSPATATPESPLDVSERFAFGAGNDRGRLRQALRKFDNAAVDPEKGLVVLDGNEWFQVDPSFWDNPWSLAEAVKDMAQFASEDGILLAGQAAGFTLGGPTGAVAGTAGAEGIRTSLGRIAGTYVASDEENYEDMGIETAYAIMGEAVSLGAKPSWKAFVRGSEKGWKAASETTKDLVAGVLGRSTFTGPGRARVLLDEAKEVGKETLVLKKKAGGRVQDAIQLGKEANVNDATKFFNLASESLNRKYDELAAPVFNKSEARNLRVDISRSVNEAKQVLIDQGYGKLDKKGKFVPLTQADVTIRRLNGQRVPVGADEKDVFREISSVYNNLDKNSKVGILQGKKAAMALADINKSVNGVYDNITFETARQAQTLTSTIYKNGVKKSFDKVGLKKEWETLNETYHKYAGAVQDARKLTIKPGEGKTRKATENFVNQITSEVGKNATVKGNAKLLEELTGKRGEHLVRKIVIRDTATAFLPKAPKFGLFQSAAAQSGAIAFSTGVQVPLAGTAMLAGQFSPALVRQEAAFLARTNDFLKSLSKSQMAEFAATDTGFRLIATSSLRGMDEENQLAGQLVNQAVSGANQATAAIDQKLSNAGPSAAEEQGRLEQDLATSPGGRSGR